MYAYSHATVITLIIVPFCSSFIKVRKKTIYRFDIRPRRNDHAKLHLHIRGDICTVCMYVCMYVVGSRRKEASYGV